MKVGIVIVVALFVLGAEAGPNWYHPSCPWVKCEADCRKVRDEDGCYMCVCKAPCVPPKCEPGCWVQEKFDGPCPGCECKKKEEEWRRPRCPWVKCEADCRKVRDEEGCYKCECKAPCVPPKCEPGCWVQEKFDGPCPGCECKKKEEVEVKRRPRCPWVKCEADCLKVRDKDGCYKCECKKEEEIDEEVKRRPKCPWVKCDEDCLKVRDEDGCYKCECKPLCAPLKCKPGCVVQRKFDGPCPGCDCKKDEEIDEEVKRRPRCPYVKCEADCLKVRDEEGCYKCECKPLCAPLKCKPGCVVQEKFDGPCPGCDCKKDEEIDDLDARKFFCGVPKCDPGCTVEKTFKGTCPGCECKVIDIPHILEMKVPCNPPKCPPGCKIEIDYEGPCPGCDCKKKEEKKKCPPLLPCGGRNCEVDIDEYGCEICLCKPECAPPKCKSYCKIKNVEGGCPVCECPKLHKG